MKTLLTALTLAALPGLAFAGCAGEAHTTTAQISCADGTVYDANTQTCVIASS